MQRKPNILILMSDEHRADMLGYTGDPIVRTPNLNGLARSGVVFTNAYTPSPVCVPARQAMMTGKLPRHCGCERFGQDLPPGSMTFARRFAQYGYSTVCSGKLHHTGTDQMQGWTQRLSGDIHIEPSYVPDRLPEEFAKYEEPSKTWTIAKEIARSGIGRGPWHIRDEYAVEGALLYIQEYFNSLYYDRTSNYPLMLKVSLSLPHYPYLTSEDKFNYYLNRVRPFLDHEGEARDVPSPSSVVPGQDATERDIRRATAAYYGMIETVDEQFGRILAQLELVGQNLDDWIIVFMSDHGEMLGEHGIWFKSVFYEASAKVPLVIRWPSRFAGGRTVTENVNLCDLFATLCELADIPAPEGLDSRSLVPLMEGASERWDNETVSQFHGSQIMIKRDHLKYQYYGGRCPEVLFDLSRDPQERRNLAEEPAYAEAMSRFRARAGELGFGPAAISVGLS